ncbi:unnamed protein product [Didymodactylos carnosus]|uniref:Integrase catalytic domain-containing protein n=1 Tax=Didymodactylos carnosus TaxID=1234261 RepID=A0A815YM99_9BILA|nr:unnamed protein product [Didymodactylos carnosus]CAF4435756.1 unnamed protein product [Didymodactylos carnosus]
MGFCIEIKIRNRSCSSFTSDYFPFGPCRVLHSDNGKEFINRLVVDLKHLFPSMLIVHGRPRNPKCQGSIERANAVLCSAIGKWMSCTKSNHWSDSLLPVVYGINTRESFGIKCTPYQIIFGQHLRSNCLFWDSIQIDGAVEHDDLPKEILDLLQNDDNEVVVDDEHNDVNDPQLAVVMNKFDVTTDSSEADEKNSNFVVNTAPDTSFNNTVVISTGANSTFVTSESDEGARVVRGDLVDSKHVVHCPILTGSPIFSRHSEIRKFATENYLNETTKRQKFSYEKFVFCV